MVAPSRAAVRVDRLRSLNIPRRVTVELDGHGLPRLVTDVGVERGGTREDEERRGETMREEAGRRIEAIGEIWRVDDEWWRKPVARRYVEVMLEGGAHVTLFEDLTSNTWFAQRL